jgi:hypothetical protein
VKCLQMLCLMKSIAKQSHLREGNPHPIYKEQPQA